MASPVRSVHRGSTQLIVFGPQTVDEVPGVVRELGARRVLVVTTAGRAASDGGARLVQHLGRAVAGVFDRAVPLVPTTAVQAAASEARSLGIDGVVSYGGGSCADLGKAVCWFVERETGTPLAHVSVPTTYSGASLTSQFVMTDPGTRRTTGAGDTSLAPGAAVFDPVITLETPAGVSAETGMSALAHGIECAWSATRTPEAEVLALGCVRETAAALPDVVDDPFDIDARTRMLRASVLGGRALPNAGPGVGHGLAQLLAGRTGLSHGLASAVLLAHAVRFTAEAVPDDAARVGDALGDPDDPPGAVDRLRERLGIPGSLADCGVRLDDLDAVARMSLGNPSVSANPRPVTEDDARAILAAAF
jgi:alcohol dehydrogenase class IV